MNKFHKVLATGYSLVLFVAFGCKDEPVTLFNGTDLSGWEIVLQDSTVSEADVWLDRDGVIHCTGVPNGYMRTSSDYENYTLNVEWRWVENAGNSGVFVHVQRPNQVWPRCIENQLMAGNAGDFVLIGSASITVDDQQYDNTRMFLGISKQNESSENPVGEWNTYRIVCEGDQLTNYVNGVLQNEGTQASFTSGGIALQSEGAPIEFRNITLERLD